MSITIFASCEDKKQWDEYVLDNGGHPFQLWGWGDLKATTGWTADRLFYHDEEGEIVGAVQLLIRKLPRPFKSMAYVPRGIISTDEDKNHLLSQLGNYIRGKYKSVVLTIEPDSENLNLSKDWKKSKNHILPSETIILDLTKSDSDLLSAMSKKTRQYIRKSSAENIHIKRAKNKEAFEACMDIYRETAKRANFALRDVKYYQNVLDKMGDHSQLFIAFYEDKPIAFLWLAISAETAYELYGGMNKIGQQLRANYALKWYAIRKCKEWGLSRYDFGGLINGGVSTFKLGWAKEPTKLVGTFDLPLSKFYGVYSKILPKAKVATRKIKSIVRR